uniref:Myosin G, putative n=1 Tax=Neospora caninum (strain Liverpool) TaxID=572307 RepID=A0A0F7UJ39_NEOCL|nr:TPA: myosin G, putative [Neospora caninum Liverpool]
MTDRCWIPHLTEVWGVAVPAGPKGSCTYKLVEVTDDGTDPRNLEVTLAKSDLAQVTPITDSRSLEGVPNVCVLGDVSEASVLHTIRVRYRRDEIYTNVGRIVLALNPFKYLPLYGPDFVRNYFGSAHVFDLPPHLFQVSAAAVKGLSERGKPQSTLITGESGAGKTESTKLILQFLADVSEISSSASSSFKLPSGTRLVAGVGQRNTSSIQKDRGPGGAVGDSTLPSSAAGAGSQGREAASLQQRILEISPVLESFGNASTSRNPNSSRFGKWIEVYFGDKLKVLGASITSYLLELPRVTRHIAGERSYHVFYQLVHGLNTSDLVGVAAAYRLKTDPLAFTYLTPQEQAVKTNDGKSGTGAPSPPHPEVDDLAGFSELKRALLILGFSPSTQNAIFSIVAAILHLGNVTFAPEAGGEKCAVAGNTRDHLNAASELLGLDSPRVEGALTSRKMKTGNESILIPLKADQADAARDSFAKLVYGYLFNWLIAQINGSLAPSGGKDFDLQHHFNADIFLNEISDYEEDGLKGVSITYEDNADVLSLIAGKGGVIATLDEEVFVPRGSDQGFLNKLNKAHTNNKRYIENKIKGSMAFGIRHYAGDVTYTVSGWLVKDQNVPPQEAAECLLTSENPIVKAVVETAPGDTQKRSQGGKSTVGSVFKKQLSELMAKINGTDSHYIRCIKPNPVHKPRGIHSSQILSQLVCSGVMEAIRIRKSGFALRLLHQDFVDRYRLVLGSRAAAGLRALDTTSAARQLVTQLIAAKGISQEECLVGQTKVFAKSNVQDFLEHAREEALVEPVILIQAVYRGYRSRQQCRVLFEVYGRLKVFLSACSEASKRGGYLTTEPVFPDAPTPQLLQKKSILLGDLISQLEALDPSLQPSCLPTVSKYHVRMTLEASLSLELERLLALTDVQGADGACDALSMLRATVLKAESKQICGPLVTEARERWSRLEAETNLGDSLDQALHANDKTNVALWVKEARQLERTTTPPRFFTSYLASVVAASEAYLAQDAREQERLQREREKAEESRKEMKERQQQEVLLMGAVEERRRSDRLSLLSVPSDIKKAKRDQEAVLAHRRVETAEPRGLRIEYEEEETVSTSESDWTDSSEAESEEPLEAYGSLQNEEGGEALTSAYLRKFMKEVARATRECDPSQLAFFLERAREANLGKGPRELQLARVQLENLNDPAFLNSELKEAVVGVTWGVATQDDVVKLRNLVQQAQVVRTTRKQNGDFRKGGRVPPHGTIDPTVLSSAMATLDALRRMEGRERGASGKNGSGGGPGERGERAGGLTAYPFESYPMLRINMRIQETKSMRKAERLVLRREELLSHQSDPLEEPLLVLPDHHAEVVALTCFRSLLGVMGDRFCVGRSALSEEILVLGRNAEDLRDEIYCQILKQLQNNPSAGSTIAGLRILQSCCQAFPPSESLEPYVRYALQSFLSSLCAPGADGSGAIKFQQEVEQVCRQAIKDLELTCEGRRGGRETWGEDQGAPPRGGEKRMHVQVRLADGSSRRLSLEGDCPRDLCRRLVKDLNLLGADSWAIMEKLSEYDLKTTTARGFAPTTFRLLPPEELVQDYLSKRDSEVQLWLRRPMLNTDEPLSLHPATAALVYRQAVSQYQQHVFNEDPGLLSSISARLLQAEGLLEASPPHVPSWPSLSWTIPQRLHWLQSEADWTAAISEAARDLDAEEGDLLAMSAAFRLMQNLRGFGGSVWLADAFPLFSADIKGDARLHAVVKQTAPGCCVSLSPLIEIRRVPLSLRRQFATLLGDDEDRERMRRIEQRSQKKMKRNGKPGETHNSSSSRKSEVPMEANEDLAPGNTNLRRRVWSALLCRRDPSSFGTSGRHVRSRKENQKRNKNLSYKLTGRSWIAVSHRGIELATVFDAEGLAAAPMPESEAALLEASSREEWDQENEHTKVQKPGAKWRNPDEKAQNEAVEGTDFNSPKITAIEANDGNSERQIQKEGSEKGIFTIPPEKLWLVAALPPRGDAPDRLLLGYVDPRTGKRRLEAFVTQAAANDVVQLVLLFFPFCALNAQAPPAE